MGGTEPAGRFPYVVDIYRPVEGQLGGYNQKQTTYKIRGQAAARVWTVNNAGASSDPADLVTHTPRLLLREPLRGIEVGWRLIWKGKLYSIDATEERDYDLLVTLTPVGRTG